MVVLYHMSYDVDDVIDQETKEENNLDIVIYGGKKIQKRRSEHREWSTVVIVIVIFMT